MTRSIIIFFAISLFSFGALQAQVSLSGQFITAEGETFGDLTINILNADGDIIDSRYVGCDGDYTINGLEENVEYTLQFEKDSNPLNGTSTFDLVLISRYILGIETFNIYQQFAADIDASGGVSVLDLVIERMLILGIIQELPNNMNRWIFFKEGVQQPENSFNIQLSTDVTGYNFVGIARGDVNYSASICN